MQLGPQCERLGTWIPARQGVRVVKQHTAVARHRAGNVDQQHDGWQHLAAPAERQRQRCGLTQRLSNGAPQIDRAPGSWHHSRQHYGRHRGWLRPDHVHRSGKLFGRHGLEVGPTQTGGHGSPRLRADRLRPRWRWPVRRGRSRQRRQQPLRRRPRGSRVAHHELGLHAGSGALEKLGVSPESVEDEVEQRMLFAPTGEHRAQG